MYKRFFGFKERPFKLVPDPAYLFLSRSHEEAMAHLTYAVSQGDGFVEITGEVGTGKTTLCRTFLESLDVTTEAAYIFNPKLDAIQLLRAVNDEFRIPSDADNTKDLIDILNAFLIEKKAEGKKVVLLIDEAQNLIKEVLEQLRLISNLETTKTKLVQIILVGQPELGEMLDSYELRQLGQRITLSCHLSPLTVKETGEYIQHRINISSQKPGMRFDRAAVRAIYKFSRGIPRLINIACDRALLTAFGLNQLRITGSIARASIRELANRGEIKRGALQKRKAPMLIFVLLCIALSMILLDRLEVLNTNAMFKSFEKKAPGILHSEPLEKKIVAKPITEQKSITRKHIPKTGKEAEVRKPEPAAKPNEVQKPVPDRVKRVEEPEPVPEQTVEAPEPVTEQTVEAPEPVREQTVGAPEPVPETTKNLGDFLKDMNTNLSRGLALKRAMKLWNSSAEIKPYLDSMGEDQAFFRLAAKQNGLLIHRIKCDLNMIKNLNLPAVLELYSPGKQIAGYLAVVKMDGDTITLAGRDEEGTIEIYPDELASYWSGVAYIPWNNFMSYRGTIPTNSSDDTILTLKMHLRDIGFDEIKITPVYDIQAKKAVKEIQKKHGIPVDGFVGSLTKIVLYNENKSLKIPHLRQRNGG